MLVADGRPVMNAQAQAPAIVYPEGEDSLPYKNIFSTAIQNDTEADVIGMGVSKKYAKIGILHENTGYGSTGAELIKKSILKARPEASIAIESYNLKAQDMTAQVARLKSAGVDVVVVVGLGADMAVARKNIQRLNWAPAVYASAGGLTPAYAQGAGDLVVGTRAPMLAAFAQPLLTPEAREFADAYFAKYGADRWWGDNKERPQITISLTVANAYDAANLLFEAIRRAGSNDREAVIAQLNKIDGYKGVNAVYSLSEKNHTGVKPQDLGFFEYVKEGDQLTFKLVND